MNSDLTPIKYQARTLVLSFWDPDDHESQHSYSPTFWAGGKDAVNHNRQRALRMPPCVLSLGAAHDFPHFLLPHWGEDTVSFLGHLRGIMSQAPSPVAGDTSWRRGQGDCSPISSIAKIRFIFYQLKGIIRTTPATTISIWTYLQWFQNRRHIYTMRLLIAWNSLYLQTSQEVTMWLSTLLSSTSFFDTLSQVSLPPWRRSSEWMSGTILAVNFNEFIVMLSFLQSVLCSYCFYEFQWKKYPKWIC